MKKLILDEEILFFAFRYALGRKTYGRKTYVVPVVVDTLIEHWDNMDKRHKTIIQKEIVTAMDYGYIGIQYDKEQWQKILNLKIK